jgi:hypothetical protein
MPILGMLAARGPHDFPVSNSVELSAPCSTLGKKPPMVRPHHLDYFGWFGHEKLSGTSFLNAFRSALFNAIVYANG